MTIDRWCIRWNRRGTSLAACEASTQDVARHAGRLAAWYDEPYNRSMMDHSEGLSPGDVIAHFKKMRQAGARPFLLHCDDTLAGDADLRRIEEKRAEFAIMVGARATQGKGLGTSFSIMIHAFAFEALALETVYLTIVPANEPGRRCYEKVGYRIDSSPAARLYADSDGDVAMSLDRSTFGRLHRAALDEIVIERREPAEGGRAGSRDGSPWVHMRPGSAGRRPGERPSCCGGRGGSPGPAL